VGRGLSCPAALLPKFPRLSRPVRDRHQEERLKQLKLWREARSRDLGIDGGILANNALLESLSEADLKKSGEAATQISMKRWQREEFGEELTELLRSV
jgi:ribonuclease D